MCYNKEETPSLEEKRMREKGLQWAMELQSLAQAGLTYGKDPYDLERYRRIREISAEMIAEKADISLEKARNLFCNETGYQTPKVDTRAAVFAGGCRYADRQPVPASDSVVYVR